MADKDGGSGVDTALSQLPLGHVVAPKVIVLVSGTVTRVFRLQILHQYVFMTSALVPMNRLARAFLDETKVYFAQQPQAVTI
ncbi:MAG: hypothetical protein WCP82_01000 [Alphaproteobacteria bacterium]